ncbi:hypothetical protein MPER_11246 [Moniliophthora perniciosa FA553]|nr:hypothetical protein MPER_11246 [Moniliophthora perniciosa FA553]
MRDASGEGSSSRWKNSKPTLIEEPSNRRPGLNPYSGGRLADNLKSSNSRRYNPSANAVLRPNRDQPPRRKKIIGPTFPLDEPFRPPNTSTKNKEKVLLANETHIISDSEEDMGDVVPRPLMGSPDQLDTLTLSDSPNPQKGATSKATPFKALSKLPQLPQTPQPEAGLSRSSPIECYDDDVVEDSSRRSTGLVQKRVTDIEKKSIPQIDLSQHQTVKGRMKGKTGAKTFEDVIFSGPSAPIDPVATSSTPFHNGKGKAREKTPISPEGKICLPVEEWCLGRIHFLRPCTISFEPKGNHVKVDYEDVEEMFYFAHITSTKWSEPGTFFCVNLTFNKPMRKQTIGSNYQDYFKPGILQPKYSPIAR